MKIYTKKGDSGETSLIGGNRVKKNHQRIEAYGTVDELNSFLGLVRDTAANKDQENLLLDIQNLLFTVGSTLAAAEGNKMNLPQLQEKDLSTLEDAMDAMDEELPALKNFILPGGDLAASYCHVGRTICRRAERKVVSLAGATTIDPLIIKYLNRLSDYLFTLARYYTLKHGGNETPWITRG
jgi:cob(I)alamin adenosyltransferase